MKKALVLLFLSSILNAQMPLSYKFQNLKDTWQNTDKLNTVNSNFYLNKRDINYNDFSSLNVSGNSILTTINGVSPSNYARTDVTTTFSSNVVVNGSVGIGTTNPQYSLDVVGSISINKTGIFVKNVEYTQDQTRNILSFDQYNTFIKPPTNTGTGTISLMGYSAIGDDANVPYIKIKKITGNNTNATEGYNKTIAHGLTGSKIIDVFVRVEYATNSFVPAGCDIGAFGLGAGYSFTYYWNATNIIVALDGGGKGINIQNKPIVIYIVYES